MDSCSAFAGGGVSMVLVVEGEKPAKGAQCTMYMDHGNVVHVGNCCEALRRRLASILGTVLVHGQRVRDLDKLQWIWIGIGKLLFKGMAD